MIQPSDLYEVAREGLVLAFMVSLPVLGAAALAGVISSLLQMFTKVSEPVLAVVPRIAAVTLVLLIALPWIGGRLADFAGQVWSLVHQVNL